jgi:hypothetical protein
MEDSGVLPAIGSKAREMCRSGSLLRRGGWVICRHVRCGFAYKQGVADRRIWRAALDQPDGSQKMVPEEVPDVLAAGTKAGWVVEVVVVDAFEVNFEQSASVVRVGAVESELPEHALKHAAAMSTDTVTRTGATNAILPGTDLVRQEVRRARTSRTPSGRSGRGQHSQLHVRTASSVPSSDPWLSAASMS